jgi:hypothetical protein
MFSCSYFWWNLLTERKLDESVNAPIKGEAKGTGVGAAVTFTRRRETLGIAPLGGGEEQQQNLCTLLAFGMTSDYDTNLSNCKLGYLSDRIFPSLLWFTSMTHTPIRRRKKSGRPDPAWINHEFFFPQT